MTDRVRAKFMCMSATKTHYAPSQTEFKFHAVMSGSEENERFHRFSPMGSLSITVDNPAIEGFYEVGREYYLDFTIAPKPAEAVKVA